MSRPKIYAFLAVLTLFFLGGLYVREYAFLFNSIGVKGLVAGSVLFALVIACGALWLGRDRFQLFCGYRSMEHGRDCAGSSGGPSILRFDYN